MEVKELSLREIMRLIWSRRILIAKIVGTVTIIAVIISLLLPKWYKSTVVIFSPSAQQIPFGAAGLISQLGLGAFIGGGEDQERFLSILRSETLMRAIARKYRLQEAYDCEDMEKTLKAFKDNYLVEVGEENQIAIAILDQDQERVADMANYAVHCLDSLNILLNTSKAHNTREFTLSRLEITLDSLLYLEKQMRQLMESEGVLSLEDQVKEGISAAAELQSELMKREVELAVARKMVNTSTPQTQKLEFEIESLKRAYRDLYEGKTGDRLFPGFGEVPRLELQFLRIKRKADYYTKVLEFLGPQYEQAKIEEAKQIPTVQVLDPAVRPERKSRPKRSRIVIAAFLISLTASFYLVYFIERRKMLRESQQGQDQA